MLLVTNSFAEIQMNKLSQEVVDYFIDHLHDDDNALKACSTVCRGWSPATRRHLFEGDFEITSLERLQFLLDPSLTWSHTHVITAWGSVENTPALLEFPCLNRFTFITTLNLHNIEAAQPDLDDLVQPFFDNFPSVHTLCITKSRFLSLHTIMRFIHSLPLLFNMSFTATMWTSKGNPMSQDLPFPVRHLLLFGPYDDCEFFDYLLDLHPILPLHSFWIGNRDSLVLRVVESCRASLRTANLVTLGMPLISGLKALFSYTYRRMGSTQHQLVKLPFAYDHHNGERLQYLAPQALDNRHEQPS